VGRFDGYTVEDVNPSSASAEEGCPACRELCPDDLCGTRSNEANENCYYADEYNRTHTNEREVILHGRKEGRQVRFFYKGDHVFAEYRIDASHGVSPDVRISKEEAALASGFLAAYAGVGMDEATGSTDAVVLNADGDVATFGNVESIYAPLGRGLHLLRRHGRVVENLAQGAPPYPGEGSGYVGGLVPGCVPERRPGL
jgi:hypothetical protein